MRRRRPRILDDLLAVFRSSKRHSKLQRLSELQVTVELDCGRLLAWEQFERSATFVKREPGAIARSGRSAGSHRRRAILQAFELNASLGGPENRPESSSRASSSSYAEAFTRAIAKASTISPDQFDLIPLQTRYAAIPSAARSGKTRGAARQLPRPTPPNILWICTDHAASRHKLRARQSGHIRTPCSIRWYAKEWPCATPTASRPTDRPAAPAS